MIDHTAAAPAPSVTALTPPPAPPQTPPIDGTARVAARADALRTHAIAYARREARLSRLRVYSYCLTLAACVLALMSFMYLAQGTADGDSSFVWLGAMFVATTALTLWLAVRVTRVGDFPA